jgi:hypothetical protein
MVGSFSYLNFDGMVWLRRDVGEKPPTPPFTNISTGWMRMRVGSPPHLPSPIYLPDG